MSRANGGIKTVGADHVDVGRLPKQLPIAISKLLSIPPHVPLCNISLNRRDMRKEIERTPINVNMTMTLVKLISDASAASCKLDMSSRLRLMG